MITRIYWLKTKINRESYNCLKVNHLPWWKLFSQLSCNWSNKSTVLMLLTWSFIGIRISSKPAKIEIRNQWISSNITYSDVIWLWREDWEEAPNLCWTLSMFFCVLCRICRNELSQSALDCIWLSTVTNRKNSKYLIKTETVYVNFN